MGYYLNRIEPIENLDDFEILNKLEFDIYQSSFDIVEQISLDEQVGYVSICLSKNLNNYKKNDIFWQFDELSGGEDMFYTFFKKIKYVEYVFILDRLTIKKEYQNKGIGSQVLRHLEEIYGQRRLKILYASPLVHNEGNYQGHDYEEVKKRLNRFYRKNKYRILKKVKGGGEHSYNIYHKF